MGEIRHSIQSVLTFAPWVRRIYVVTDGQRPSWLRALAPKVVIIDHREIFSNSSWLPCYAARGIESQLHHIPGLADHFIYLNDDMFLGRPVSPLTFFDRQGRPRVFTNTRRPRPRVWHAQPALLPPSMDASHCGSVEQSRLLAFQSTHKLVAYDIRHQPKAVSRPLMVMLEEMFSGEFAEVASKRFRSASTINPLYLHAFYALATGAARPHYVRSIRANHNWKDVLIRTLDLDDSCCINLDGGKDEERLARVESARPRFICINQTAEADDTSLMSLTRLMNKIWPLDRAGLSPATPLVQQLSTEV